jgi:hypothetical protein
LTISGLERLNPRRDLIVLTMRAYAAHGIIASFPREGDYVQQGEQWPPTVFDRPDQPSGQARFFDAGS